MKERHLTPREAAVCLMTILERRGAVFTLHPDGTFLCNLDGANLSGHAEAADLAQVVLGLRDEIRQLLVSDRTVN